MEQNEHTVTVQRLMFTCFSLIVLQIFTVFLPLMAQILHCLYV